MPSSKKCEDFTRGLHLHKKHSSIFNNALRPNSALRQLFPTAKEQANNSKSNTDYNLVSTDDTIDETEVEVLKKTIERNIFRRSLTKYEPR